MKGYLAMKLATTAEVSVMGRQCDMSLIHKENGVLGCCWVYRTKTAARKAFGRDVQLVEIEIGEPEAARVEVGG